MHSTTEHSEQCMWLVALCTGYHFSGISGNLEMSGNSTKVGKRPKVRERLGNFCSQGNLIVADHQNNLPVLYSYCYSLCQVGR